jgi:hypothetical protein
LGDNPYKKNKGISFSRKGQRGNKRKAYQQRGNLDPLSKACHSYL